MTGEAGGGPRTFTNLSPSPQRTGRACVWVEHEGRVLMTGLEWGGWTLPGGGIHPGETGAQAAVREAWEESGAQVEVTGEPITLEGGELCFPARLLALHPSPEGRPVTWVNPRALPWAEDVQLRQALAARGETPAHLVPPPLVLRAEERARKLGFGHVCSPEVGRLLRTLAAARPGGRLAELGSGTGVGAAWLLAGLDGAARLLTVELDPERALSAQALLDGESRVEVRHGDGTLALEGSPFDLIFSDCAPAKAEGELNRLVDALKPGGLLVLDSFSPPHLLPERCRAGDPLREALFRHSHLTCVELAVSARERVILATRTT